jgi:hypothetical protein
MSTWFWHKNRYDSDAARCGSAPGQATRPGEGTQPGDSYPNFEETKPNIRVPSMFESHV